MGVPDLRFINKNIRVIDVACALDLRISTNGNIHCWRPELHQHGDRTASVGIHKLNNTVKCFGCDAGPFGPVDLIMAVRGLKNPADAARWIAERFDVPDAPVGRHLVFPDRRPIPYGFESDLGLLIRSGLWRLLSPPARSLVPVLLEFAEPDPETKALTITMSYRAMVRYAGVSSPNAIRAALRQLEQIDWLHVLPAMPIAGSGPVRNAASYLLTPRSDNLIEHANANVAKMRAEIAAERQQRQEARTQRRRTLFTK